MYRDLVGEVVKITVNERTWYYQQFCTVDGNLKAVRLYDEDGEFVTEFNNLDDCWDFVEGVKE